MFLVPLGILSAALAGPATLDWERVDAVRAVGFEQIAKGILHPFTVAREGNSLVYSCAKDIDGELAGILRTEVVSDRGVFTWLAANPKLVLQLPVLSAPDVASTVFPVRFPRATLMGNPSRLARELGKRVELKGKDSIASRDCEVVLFSDRTSLIQSLWVDTKTGMPLRQQDKVGQDVVYERQLSSVQTDANLPATMFSVRSDAVTVRGLVSASILTSKPKNATDFDRDLNQLRSSSTIVGGGWIQPLVVPMEFAYMSTSHMEGEPLPTAPTINLPQVNLQSGIGSFNGFGGTVPAGLAVPGQVVLSGGAIYYGVTAPPNELPRDLSTQLAGSMDYDPAERALGFGRQLNPDGSVVVRVPSDSPADARTHTSATNNPAGVGLVRSEFLNTRTGDTITYLQLHNVTLSSIFKNIRLPASKYIHDDRFGNVATYEVVKPMTLHVIEWRSGDCDYALVSNRLTSSELQSLADRTR